MKTTPSIISTCDIFNMARFIVRQNYNHHKPSKLNENQAKEVNNIYDEELTYMGDSKVIIERDSDGWIKGTVRVLEWNMIDPLPIQKIFKVNPLDHVDLSKVNRIFHFGRLAIRKNCPSIFLLKKLIALAIKPVCQHRNNVAFAECDNRLFKTLSLLGIRLKVVGKSRDYLGSETFPVKITYEDLIGFYDAFKSDGGYSKVHANEEVFSQNLAV